MSLSLWLSLPFQVGFPVSPVTGIRGFGGPVKSQVGILCHPMNSIEVILTGAHP